VAQQREPAEAERLLTLALALREAATRARRPDVGAKADEIIALLGPIDEAAPERGSSDKGNTIVRILDGLGF
jgi:hypothetical protein